MHRIRAAAPAFAVLLALTACSSSGGASAAGDGSDGSSCVAQWKAYSAKLTHSYYEDNRGLQELIGYTSDLLKTGSGDSATLNEALDHGQQAKSLLEDAQASKPTCDR